MGDTTQINLRVSQEQKDEWESHVGESAKYKTLTGLIRGAVHNEISSEENGTDETHPALHEDVQKIREELKDIKTDVAWLRQREQSDASIEELAQDVYSSLATLPEVEGPLDVPEEVDAETFRNQLAAERAIEPRSEGESRTLHTKQAIAERVGVEPKRVESAIDHLQEQFLPVVAIKYDGRIHYFKEE